MFPEDSQTPAGEAPLEASSLSRLRDFEKVRERILLRVEPRHVVQLCMAALLLSGLAFVGGYVVGVRGYRPEWLGDWLTPRAQLAAPDHGLSSGLASAEYPLKNSKDAEAASPDVGAQAPADDVTSASGVAMQARDPADPGTEVPVADPGEQVIAAVATADQAVAEGASQESSPNWAVAAGSAAAAGSASGGAEGAGAESAGAEASGGEGAAPAAPSRAQAGTPDTAGGGTGTGGTAVTAPPRIPRAGRPAVGRYMVQIKAFRAQVDADAFAEELRSKGHTVAVSSVEVADKGQFFRVRMGPFGTLDAARAAQKRLEQAEGHATIILATP